jgi:ABC-type transport system involved in multi-copper enzyme maturation permease subunit
MTAMTTTATTATLHAEWTKARTLRSTWVIAAGSVALSLLFAAIVATSQANDWAEMTAAERAAFDPTSVALVGVLFTTILFGAFAVRAVAGEHSTGMIRTTFAALPGRRRVVLAKAVIAAALAFPVTLAGNTAAFLLGQRILSPTGEAATLGDPGTARAIAFGALAVSAAAVLGVGLGGILRRTAAATTAVSVAILGSQMFSVAVPASARPYLPGTALQAAGTGRPADDLLSPVAGLATLGAYALAALVAAVVLVERRDA